MFSISTLRRDFRFLLGIVAVLAVFSLSEPAWAVGSTPVTVVNPADIAKAEGIQQPFQFSTNCAFGGGGSPANLCQSAFGTVNFATETQRVVIEFVTGQCLLVGDNIITQATIGTNVNGGARVNHNLAVQAPAFPFGQQPSTISQLVRIYADPVSSIVFRFTTLLPNTEATCTFSLSGQVVDTR